jgi:hypothetical protein
VGDNYNALLFAIQQGAPTPLEQLRRDLDPALVGVVQRAMASEAAARFQSAQDMASALQPWLSLEAAAHAPPESSAPAFAPTLVPSSRPPRN